MRNIFKIYPNFILDHQGPSSEALPLECAPCCEVITSQTRTDYRPTDKGEFFAFTAWNENRYNDIGMKFASCF